MRYFTSKAALFIWACVFVFLSGLAKDIGFVGVSIASGVIAGLAVCFAIVSYLDKG